MIQLSIIIINYNTFRLTSNCLLSIKEKVTGINYEIILVDNASVECNPELFLNDFPDVRLIASPSNTGFTGGNNLGLEYSEGEYILLLNSDTELINNAPKTCLDYMKQNPKVGMTTAQLSYPDGKLQYNCRRFRTISWELLEIFPFYKLLPKRKAEELMLHHYFDHQRFCKCDWVWGAFMLFPKKIVPQLPSKKLSGDFFMYSEDVLWCWEFKKLGYEIHFLPEAKVMHVNKGSSSPEKAFKTKVMAMKNHAIFMKKFYPDWRWYIFTAIYYFKQYVFLGLSKVKNNLFR
jgi:GT2 family glycosyltransferase